MTRLPLLFLSLYALRVVAGSTPKDSPLQQTYNYLEELPTCAYDCVVQFSQVSFPGCESGNLDCLCTSRSETSFTLGEGAVECLASNCPNASPYLLEAAYALCSGVKNAQPETHATLEASMPASATIVLTPHTTSAIPTTTTARSRFTTLTRPSATSHPTSLHSKSHSSSTSDSIVLFTSTFSTHPFPTESATPTAVSSATDHLNSTAVADQQPVQPVLSKGQIAGIAVSGTVISAIALGLIFCLFRSNKLRRRRRRDSDASFGERGDYQSQHPTPKLDSRVEEREKQLGVAPKARQFLGIPANPAQKRWTLWRKAMAKDQPEGDVERALSPEAPFEPSPVSVKSYHTTSRLLPEKPQFNNVGWQPSPSRLRPEQRNMRVGDSHISPKQPVRFASEVGMRIITPTPPGSQGSSSGSWQDQNTSQSALQSQSLRHQLSDPFIDNTALSAAPIGSGRRASNRDLPKIITPDSQQYPMPQHQPMRPMRYPGQPHQQRAPQFAPPPNHGMSMPYVSPRPMDPYSALTPANEPRGQRSMPAAPESSDYFSKWQPLRSSARSTRPLTHYTTGSDTSFEDDGDGPQEDVPVGLLTPVAESPAAKRNGGGNGSVDGSANGAVNAVYYPPVPGSTASAKRLQVTPRKDTTQPGLTSPFSPEYNNSPIELPDSSPDPTSQTSPNFSRPQLPQQPPPRRQLDYQLAPPKWQVMSSPGLNGEQETWSSPIAPGRQQQQQQLRPTIVQVKNDQRGPWRGRDAPIGMQWHHGRAAR